MISNELQKKINRSIKLLQSIGRQYDGVIQVAYSGGKDSDVILQLAKEAGINYKAIYQNTTIDPPGTIQHVKDMGVEILRPKMSFAEILQKVGQPTRWFRVCCQYLKEYKVQGYNKSIIGVRREESVKRAKRYKEPTECRYFGKKTEENHVEQIYPILDWTTQDVADYLQDREIKCAPVYYDRGGEFHPERRLGCMCCPLMSIKKRRLAFKQYPKMLRLYVKNIQIYMKNHPESHTARNFANAYEVMYIQLFCDSTMWKLNEERYNLFGDFDPKKLLEDYFEIKLD